MPGLQKMSDTQEKHNESAIRGAQKDQHSGGQYIWWKCRSVRLCITEQGSFSAADIPQRDRSLSGRQAAVIPGLGQSVTGINVTKIPLSGLHWGSVGSERLFSSLSHQVLVNPEIGTQLNMQRNSSIAKKTWHFVTEVSDCFVFYWNVLSFQC